MKASSFELPSVLDMHGQRDLKDMIAQLQDELHEEAVVGVLLLAAQQPIADPVVGEGAGHELVEDVKRLVGIALKRVVGKKNPLLQVGAPLFLFRRHYRNCHLHQAFEDAHRDVGLALKRELYGVGRLVKLVSCVVHPHVDFEVMARTVRARGVFFRLLVAVDAKLLVVRLVGRDAIFTLDAPHGSPWQGPFGEVVFNLLGKMLIAVVAFLMVEEPVVADLVGNGMGQLLEFDLGSGQSTVAANALRLVTKIDAFAVRPQGVVADDVVVALEPVEALNQGLVDFRMELPRVGVRELRHWRFTGPNRPAFP